MDTSDHKPLIDRFETEFAEKSSLLRKEESELKRPDLRGDFLCLSCGQNFKHGASLNRHRKLVHSDEYTCMLCARKLYLKETVRDHMRNEHYLGQVYTCGCCNWTFSNKKALTEHAKAIQETGAPGDANPIAKSGNSPGSLLKSPIQRAGFKLNRLLNKSLSPSTSNSTTSSSSRDASGSPQPELELKLEPEPEPEPNEEALEYKRFFNNAVDTILQRKFFTDQQITEVDTWVIIIESANALATALQSYKKAQQIQPAEPAMIPEKRIKPEIE